MKVICATGTPGTGKTTLSKKLANKLDFLYLDVNKIISRYTLSEGYDKKRKARVIDTNILNEKLILEIKTLKKNKKYRGIIIDSHLSHYLPRKYVDFCIVAKCDINELNKRLKKKKFHQSKIKENIQAEIFDICLNEAKHRKHRIIGVDTTKGFNIGNITRMLGE